MGNRGRFSIMALVLALAATPCAAQVTTGMTQTYPTPNGGWSQFLTATCGASCADPSGEQSSDQQNWNALVQLGTTQYLGVAYNGVTIDPSSLIAASRVMGATTLDTWLTTGVAPSTDVITQMSSALVSGNGYDVSYVTGMTDSSATTQTASDGTGTTAHGASTSDGTGTTAYGASTATPTSIAATQAQTALQQVEAQALTALTGQVAQGIFSGGQNSNSLAGAGTSLCSPSVASTQNAQAQSFINNMMQIITGPDGISQQGGGTVSAGQPSPSGFFGSSCLQGLMSGTRDSLFKPPGLSSLLSQLTSMFGGSSGGSGGSGSSGGGGCGNATSPLAQVQSSLQSGMFFSGGGFFPQNSIAGEGATNVFPIPATGSTASITGGINGLFTTPNH